MWTLSILSQPSAWLADNGCSLQRFGPHLVGFSVHRSLTLMGFLSILLKINIKQQLLKDSKHHGTGSF